MTLIESEEQAVENNLISCVKERLLELSGNNADFYKSVIPGCSPVLGVRVPELRKLAKRISAGDYQQFLKSNPMDSLEMEMLSAFVIGYAKDDISVLLKHFAEMIPSVHDWAVCDALCQSFKIAEKHQDETLKFLSAYFGSREEFEVRVCAVMLLSHFVNDTYIDRVIEILDKLDSERYYACMGIAWAFSVIAVKYPQKCMDYFKSGTNLSKEVFNKSIQKMRESYRISADFKSEASKLIRQE